MFIPRLRRRTLVAGTAVLLLAVAAVVTWVVWPRGTEFQQALRMLPSDVQRVSWTDWAGVRDELHAGDVAGSDATAESFLAEVQDRELTTSSLASASGLIAEGLGFSPLAAEWELLGQAQDGQIVVLRTDQDLATVMDRITGLGFVEPGDDATEGGIWAGGPDAIAEVAGLATYELQNLAFFVDEGLVLGSDNAGYLAGAVNVVRGDTDGLDVDDLLSSVGDPLAATVLVDDRACAELSLGTADDAARATAADLVEQAGGVSPLTGYVVALGAAGRLTVVFGFEDDGRAERNRTSRAALARSEDPAQMLAYPDIFRLDDAVQDDRTVVLTGTVRPGAYAMSSLARGPVLLASC